MWVDINRNNDAGSIALPLLDFVTDGEVAPLPARPAPAALLSGNLGLQSLTIDASFSIGLFGMGASGKGHWSTDSWRSAIWTNILSPAGGDAVPVNVRWGSGFDVHVQHEDLQVSLNLPALVGLAVEAGLTQAFFAVDVFGLSLPDTLAKLPAPGSFDEKTAAALQTGIDGLAGTAFGAKDANVVTPVPMAVEFDGAYAKLAISKAVSIAFAMQCLSGNIAYEDAITKANAKQGVASSTVLSNEVARVYTLWQATGNPSSQAFQQARSLAQSWLNTNLTHDVISNQVSATYPIASPQVATASLGETASFDRIVLRSQAVDAHVAAKLGFGGFNANSAAESSNLIYEVFLRRGVKQAAVSNGVSRIRAQYSGFQFVSDFTKVTANLQASFAAVAASTSLGVSKASFSLNHFGLDPTVIAGVLQNQTFQANEFLGVQAALGEALVGLGEHPDRLKPEEADIAGGADFVEHSFPGARAISWALAVFAQGKALRDVPSFAAQLGLDKTHLMAVYGHLWPLGTANDSPPQPLRNIAQALVNLTVLNP